MRMLKDEDKINYHLWYATLYKKDLDYGQLLELNARMAWFIDSLDLMNVFNDFNTELNKSLRDDDILQSMTLEQTE